MTETAIVCKNREDWLEQRKDLLTASDAASILGQNPWKSAMALYAEKLGLMPPQEETQKMRSGRKLQRAIAEMYSEDTGRTLVDPGEFTIAVHPEVPYVAATLDYRQKDKDQGEGVLEIKNNEGEWIDEPPVYVQIQVQHQLP